MKGELPVTCEIWAWYCKYIILKQHFQIGTLLREGILWEENSVYKYFNCFFKEFTIAFTIYFLIKTKQA